MGYESSFRDDCLKGKVAFVSGGGSGIGLKITEAFLRHGAKVVIMSRNIERLTEAANKLQADIPGSTCLPVQADVRNEEAVKAAVAKAVQTFGQIDILVNGAAGNFLVPAEKLSVKGFKTVLEIDTVGTFAVTREVFKQSMKPRKSGTIINITMTFHWNGELLQTHAGAAKAGVEAMARHLANEWGKYGVRINNLAPGSIEGTEGFRKLGGELLMSEEAKKTEAYVRDEILNYIAMRRFGTTDDIAQSALYLASDASRYVTGTTLVVDGGAWFFSGGRVGAKAEEFMLKSKSRL
jgi:peroxisomal 2,4-dienoyl-CoA reductase